MKIGYILQTNAKGQIVIPQAIRKALGIDPNVYLRAKIQGHGLFIAPVQDVVEKATVDDTAFKRILEITRGAWGKPTKKEIQREKKQRELELAAARQAKQW